MHIDPRGPFRTIASVEWTPSANLVSFVECGHVARCNAAMTQGKPGTQDRCSTCGQEAVKAAKDAEQAACSHTWRDGRTAASGPHNDHLRCALCRVPMAWNGTKYIPKSAR